MWHGHWQREEIEQAIALARQAGRIPGDAVFVNAGANIGVHVLYAMHSGAFARAVAFEPEPNNARLLRMNVAANALQDRVTVIEAALGGAEGRALLHLHPRNKGAHAIGVAPSFDGQQSIEVTMTRLDAALAAQGIAPAQIGLVWIDVEGLEREVVAGLGEYLGRAPLVLEYAPGRTNAPAARELCDLLPRHYSQLRRLGPDARTTESITALADIDSITDILVL
jgi:FkbM family methyltransferase